MDLLSGVLLRRATPADVDAVAQVHVRSWQRAYRGLLPDEYLDALQPAERAARYTFGEVEPGQPSTVVAVEGDVICGFATIGPCSNADMATAGELYGLYVHPDWWSHGAGRMLLHDARRRLVDDGFSHAALWVLVGNERAQGFYDIDGWRPDGQRRLQEVHGIVVDEIRFTRRLA